MTATHALSPSHWENVWIAIPAYQEAKTVRALVTAALTQCPRVIVVDDGSNDGTPEVLHDLGVTLLRHDTNQGKGNTLRTAFRYALDQGAHCVITLDGDGQHNPIDASALLNVWCDRPRHLVIGSRLHDRAQIPVARYRANRFACFWISWAAGHPIADSQSGFRVYSREVMSLALSKSVQSQRFTFESEILIEAAQHGHLTVAVAIPGCYPKQARPSHFRPVLDIAHIVILVGGRLLKRGMAPLALWRSLKPARVLPGRLQVAQATQTAPEPRC